MTNKYLKNLALFIVTAVSLSALAGDVDYNIKTEGTFCINDNGHIYGWSI